ncbi:MAG: hypothetical protein KJO79_09505 [Verrucomicrobiae bacterium]|nr:hypothetical protein [Verrucomicrobiae bacterium]NNJ87406.1 hypothetical protein [Akkermansiaceae bacterium]
MFDAKKLNEEQVQKITEWAADGAQLADIQKRMEDEMEIRLTYMDTRFLVLDLGIEIRNIVEEQAASDEVENSNDGQGESSAAGDQLTEDDLEILPPEQGAENVSVTVDEIARPGVMASGRVTFADGQGGMWYVDEMGRLGLDPDTEGYRPAEESIAAFQRELQRVMEAR